MMPLNSTYRHVLSLALFLCLALGIFTGCDAIETESAVPGVRRAPISKMRHAHLFGEPGAAKVLERYAEFSAYTEFVMGFSATGQLDPLKVLERYDQEAGVTVKRLFTKSVKGLAVHIEADQLEHILGLTPSTTTGLAARPTRCRTPSNWYLA